MGKSGREIWISVFAMMISSPELVKIKRGNNIKEVRSGVVGTPTWIVGVCSGTDIITTDRVGALSSTIITARGRVGALSRADGHGRGHDGGAQREISGAQRSGGHGRRGGWCA